MKIISSREAREILRIKNYGALAYRLMKYNIKSIEGKVIKGKYTKFYSEDDILKIKENEEKN